MEASAQVNSSSVPDAVIVSLSFLMALSHLAFVLYVNYHEPRYSATGHPQIRITREDDATEDLASDTKSNSEITTTTAVRSDEIADDDDDDDDISGLTADNLEIEEELGIHFGTSPTIPTTGLYLFLIPSTEEV
ncbi:hypothetical protein FOZ63_033020 [Perkinsus olseni]|uniref:Uncharacterized protein n=1 Tax=Perkinsus olseni TaxID=32597 RepID=A0A7J6UBD0_PEROL|nr:hypothetical protein FOZ62_021844 [Perkinsus olseni]KAF4754487.1 hypothetical protein FOZ63_033020 [Perkinsus olseni]